MVADGCAILSHGRFHQSGYFLGDFGLLEAVVVGFAQIRLNENFTFL